MFIFTQYCEITDDEKQAHIGTQQDVNLAFSHYTAEGLEWFRFKFFAVEL